MVELVEVEDESFQESQPGPAENDDDYYTDTESEISTDDEDEIPDETLLDRVAALKDIIPPTTRSYISNKVDTAASWAKSGLFFSGQTLWVIGTSALLLGVPWALAFAEEQQVQEMEAEMRAREAGADVLSAGGNTAEQVNAQLGGGQTKASL